MAYNDPPTDRPATRPSGWSDPPADRDVRRGRHRARHADAAPDAYEDEAYGYAYGDGVSAHPMYGRDPASGDTPRDQASGATSRDPMPRDGQGAPAGSGGRRPSHAVRDEDDEPARRPADAPRRAARSGESVARPYAAPPRRGAPNGAVPEMPDARTVTGSRRPDIAGALPVPAGTRAPSVGSAAPALDEATRQVPLVPAPPLADETANNLGPVEGRTSSNRGEGRGDEPAASASASANESGGAAQPASGSSRAGRNLPAAIGVGLLLAGIVVGSLFLWKPAFVAVLAAAACVGVWEMVHAFSTAPGRAPVTGEAATAKASTAEASTAEASTNEASTTEATAGRSTPTSAVSTTDASAAATSAAGPRAQPPLVPLLGGCLVMAPLAYYGGIESLVLGLLVTILAVIVWRLSSGPAGFARDIAAAVLIATYVPFLLNFGVLLAVPHDGDLRVLAVLAMVVLSDTGGYAAGVFFGKHPMAPTISPKKSWEGLAGSLVATGVGAALLVHYLLHQPLWHGAILGVVVSAAAVLGDLAESLIKRDLGIKDMSHLLPGHGGLMDRLDSVVFAAPAAFMLLALLAPVST
jgi:CDP-diglyceride synthetase